MERVKTLLVDDYVSYRWGLFINLTKDKTLEIVEQASDGIEAIEKTRTVRPDVVLMDLTMPRCDGLEATRRIMAEMPDVRMLILTASDADIDVDDALHAGARGYVLKTETPEWIVQAIHCVAKGGLIFSASVNERHERNKHLMLPVKTFQSCPNLDCIARSQPSLYGETIPDHIRSLAQGGKLMVCGQCHTVWYEERHTDLRSYYVLREPSANRWLNVPRVVTHVLEFALRRRQL